MHSVFNENEKHVWASVEPSGLLFMGLMEDADWVLWKKQFKTIASEQLGFKVGETELDGI